MAHLLSAELVAALVDQELHSITNLTIKEQLTKWLVTPRLSPRAWDYGEPGTKYDCWVVLEHHESNTAIAYCEQGFGPENPWGLLFLEGKYLSMGMDSGWFPKLEQAFTDSFAWEEG